VNVNRGSGASEGTRLSEGVARPRWLPGTKRREKGLARSGNARVRRGMIQLAWRFLMFQKESALATVSAQSVRL